MKQVNKTSNSKFTEDFENHSSMRNETALPDELKGWSWGAFFLSWVWAIGNKTWIGLLVLVPYVGFIMSFVLGFKGREWAWKNKRWDNYEHFQRVQKRWSFWGVCIFVAIFILGIIGGIAIPAYQDYMIRVNGM